MRLKFLFIAILLLSLYCGKGISLRPAERECQEVILKNYQAVMGDYIVGGQEAEIAEFPYVVALALDVKNGPLYHCGGTLVSRNCVVTAAHCVDTVDPNFGIIIRTGSNDIGNSKWNPKTDIRVEKKHIHPLYDRTMKYHDIAVMCFDPPRNLTEYVYPICMESSHEDPKGKLQVMGWGDTTFNGSKSTSLRKAEVEAVSRAYCDRYYNMYKDALPYGITDDTLCAKDPKGRQDACQGDSGGPLVKPDDNGRSRLVGVTAFGRKCATDAPGVYMRISNYIDWIERIVFPKH